MSPRNLGMLCIFALQLQRMPAQNVDALAERLDRLEKDNNSLRLEI